MKTTVIQPHKSSLGMDANMAVLVIYIAMAVVTWLTSIFIGYIAWVVPLIFFFMEKESKFVKFQAVQACIIGIVKAILDIVFSIIHWGITPKNPQNLQDALNLLVNLNRNTGAMMFVSVIRNIIDIALTLFIIYIVVMAYGYKQVEIPVIAPIAAKASEKLENMNINFNQQNNANQNQQNNATQQNKDDSNNNSNNQP